MKKEIHRSLFVVQELAVYREVILAVRTRFSGYCCCGELAVVERLRTDGLSAGT